VSPVGLNCRLRNLRCRLLRPLHLQKGDYRALVCARLGVCRIHRQLFTSVIFEVSYEPKAASVFDKNRGLPARIFVFLALFVWILAAVLCFCADLGRAFVYRRHAHSRTTT